MRHSLAATLVAFAVAGVTQAHTSPAAASGSNWRNGLQISDILGAVKSTFTGKTRRRRYGRYRGSNRPILAKPPAIPARRPGGETVAQVTPPASPKVPDAEIPAAKPVVAARPIIIAALPAEVAPVAIPSRRPARTKPQQAIKPPQKNPAAEDTVASIVPPPPAIWQPGEISAAYDACDVLLGKKTVDIVPVEPIRKGPCGMPGPVKLSKLGAGNTVAVKPAATLNCRTIARIHDWMEKKVQPAALQILKSPVVRIRNVSSYSCRRRNNSATGKLSEHALGNALDIAGFVLADGRTISVLSDWGTVKRDVKTKNEAAADQMQVTPTRITTARPTPILTRVSFNPRVPLPIFKGPVRRGVRLNRVPDPGRAKTKPTRNDRLATQPKKPATPAQPPAKSVFLKQIHADACGIFGTVLGPEANDAHRDHFHVDTAKRRYKAYCR